MAAKTAGPGSAIRPPYHQFAALLGPRWHGVIREPSGSVLAEFKEPKRPAKAAFDENITDYRDTIRALFVPNAFVICSNGSEAKLGATYAPWEFFGDWKVIDADGTRCVVALETAIGGTCAHDRLLDLVENFTSFIERPGGLIKVVARNHQLLGVNSAIENLLRVRSAGEKRLGVFWHTQGSGKSLSMLGVHGLHGHAADRR